LLAEGRFRLGRGITNRRGGVPPDARTAHINGGTGFLTELLRMTGFYRLLAVAALSLLTAAGLASAQPDERRAEAELIADRASVAPGDTFYAALKMTMDEGWHIYWRNAGDAGLPPQLILEEGTTLPEDA